MSVSAIIVTRGNVDLQPIIESLPIEWERIVWDNSGRLVRWPADGGWNDLDLYTLTQPRRKYGEAIDLSVYGRYVAIEYASHDLIYVQDDDVIVSDPKAIVRAWSHGDWPQGALVANMPQEFRDDGEFRHDGYWDSCLVGFGACFHRDLPTRAFDRFFDMGYEFEWPEFHRTCDVVFTTLTPRVLVDVPKTNLDYATGPDRMYRQPDHVGERARMLELARKVRDA